jgi:hypothetical protein
MRKPTGILKELLEPGSKNRKKRRGVLASKIKGPNPNLYAREE